jgi:cytochrome c-type biogenesis protein CcmE
MAQRSVTGRAIKIGLTAVVLALAFGGLLFSTLSEGAEYYKHVDEVMAEPETWYGKPLQLHGFVVADSIFRRRDSLDYRFRVQSNGYEVAASYSGVVPDNFQNDAEVVLKGRLGPDGFEVERNGIMAKCPSKYEPKPGAGAGPSVGQGY